MQCELVLRHHHNCIVSNKNIENFNVSLLDVKKKPTDFMSLSNNFKHGCFNAAPNVTDH